MLQLCRRIVPFVFVVGAAAWICARNTLIGDYDIDAGPAVDALAAGRLGDALEMHPLMGPVSIFLRAPFAALGGSELAAYNWGAFPCVLAPGLLGIYLARVAGERGAGTLFRAILIVVCIINPLTFKAMETGHPEELLAAALVIGSAVSAATGAGWRAVLLLGLALATKQWAVIAFFPILMALPAHRVRAGLTAAGIALLFVLPGIAADPDGFVGTQTEASGTHGVVTPWSVWYPLSPVEEFQVDSVDGTEVVALRRTSEFVGVVTHPLIVALGLLLPLGVAAWRGRLPLTAQELMAVLALLFLFRCALDPVNNLYYHAPLLMALAASDALFPATRLPARFLAAAALLTALPPYATGEIGLLEFSLIYGLIAVLAAAALFASLRVRPRPAATAGAGDARPAFS